MVVFSEVLQLFTVVTISISAGLYFIFSNTIIGALKAMSSNHGAEAMVSINRIILNPLFYIVFFGSALSALMLIVLGDSGGVGSLGIIGASVFFVGTFLVTLVFNVPLNNKLMNASDSGSGIEDVWQEYVSHWLLWNHVRTFSSTIAIALLFVDRM